VGSEALLGKNIKRSFDDFTYSMIRRRKAEIEEARGTGKSTKVTSSL
jgi:hypothetical protein